MKGKHVDWQALLQSDLVQNNPYNKEWAVHSRMRGALICSVTISQEVLILSRNLTFQEGDQIPSLSLWQRESEGTWDRLSVNPQLCFPISPLSLAILVSFEHGGLVIFLLSCFFSIFLPASLIIIVHLLSCLLYSLLTSHTMFHDIYDFSDNFLPDLIHFYWLILSSDFFRCFLSSFIFPIT